MPWPFKLFLVLYCLMYVHIVLYIFFISSINYILMCLDITEMLLPNFISLSLITELVLTDDQMCHLSLCY